MIRENQKHFNRIQVLLDLSIIVAAFIFSYWARFVLLDGKMTLQQHEVISSLVLLLVVYGLSYYNRGLYSSKRRERLFRECRDVIVAHIMGIIIFMVGLYFFKFTDFSRIQ